MKKILIVLFILDVIGFITGYVILNYNVDKGNQIIGISLVILIFLIVPIFLFMRYNKKKASDFVYKKKEE